MIFFRMNPWLQVAAEAPSQHGGELPRETRAADSLTGGKSHRFLFVFWIKAVTGLACVQRRGETDPPLGDKSVEGLAVLQNTLRAPRKSSVLRCQSKWLSA